MAIPFELLARQDSSTSGAVIEFFSSNADFKVLYERLSAAIMQRDLEDSEKLQSGIDLAVAKGVLPRELTIEPTMRINVAGKTPDVIADEIIMALGDAPSRGCAMTLQGLSGTGKGTTVAKLQEKVPRAQTWSNGNVFRSLTFLVCKYAEANSIEIKDALAPEILASAVNMLTFDMFNGRFDVKIDGFGFTYLVSEVEKTVLKDPQVARHIPMVAEVTQGEVINFVQGALAKMAAAGVNVLLEGREQTLNHIRTPFRFELMLEDSSVIGQRQAGLLIAGKAYETLKGNADATPDDVSGALRAALAALMAA
eukprot:NODE_14431_length_1109_cov_6.910387.p1 GENE.NODE_14431_length_1109_cov_6.910387~~NODE_14431_length_1109_cov_6.910387.p1  ORF type:complete len:330 (+),score=113.07 NODE_14431_length_1109_cov_6.910387:63-992(+)